MSSTVRHAKDRACRWIRLHRVALGLAALLASCTQTPPSERAITFQRSASVVVPPDIVSERVEAELKSLGFTIEAAGGGIIRAERLAGLDNGFANCQSIRVAAKTGGESTRFRRVEPIEERVRVVARISQLNEATNVTIDPLMVGVYVNSFTNRQTEAPCQSNGTLEKAIVTAVEQLGPAPGSKDAG